MDRPAPALVNQVLDPQGQASKVVAPERVSARELVEPRLGLQNLAVRAPCREARPSARLTLRESESAVLVLRADQFPRQVMGLGQWAGQAPELAEAWELGAASVAEAVPGMAAAAQLDPPRTTYTRYWAP